MKYKIGIIDDEADTIRAFKRDVNDDFEVIELDITKSIPEIIEDIIEMKLKAVVVDFDLQNHKFTGIDIVEELNKVIQSFPTFILTALDEEAENFINDVNMIYQKKSGSSGEVLNRRIKKQIETHEKNLEEAKLELKTLLSRRGSLTVFDEDRLIELDRFIENSAFKLAVIPEGVKINMTFDKRIIELLESTEELLKELKENDDEN
jgi:hypothetical protein